MYLPTAFEETRVDVLHAALRAHPLGLLVTHGEAGLQANPIPFLVDPGPGPFGTLRGHVARVNPLWREAASNDAALVVFQGPQAYVSPSWYASKAEHGKVVPTWNYVMVQARGRLRTFDDAAGLHALVSRLTQTHEAAMPAPWAVADAPADYVDALLRAIVGIEIEIVALAGKWKLSQNRPAADREGVARGLDSLGTAAAGAMAQQVRQPGSA